MIDRTAQDPPWAGSPGARAAIAEGTVADLEAIPTYMAKLVADDRGGVRGDDAAGVAGRAAARVRRERLPDRHTGQRVGHHVLGRPRVPARRRGEGLRGRRLPAGLPLPGLPVGDPRPRGRLLLGRSVHRCGADLLLRPREPRTERRGPPGSRRPSVPGPGITDARADRGHLGGRLHRADPHRRPADGQAVPPPDRGGRARLASRLVGAARRRRARLRARRHVVHRHRRARARLCRVRRRSRLSACCPGWTSRASPTGCRRPVRSTATGGSRPPSRAPGWSCSSAATRGAPGATPWRASR